MANPAVFSPQDSAASGSAPRARGANGRGSVWSPVASSWSWLFGVLGAKQFVACLGLIQHSRTKL